MRKIKQFFKTFISGVKQFFNKLKYYPIEIIYSIITLYFLVAGKSGVVLILLLVVVVANLIHFLYFTYTRRKVGSYLKNNNVHLFGFRRKGKDLTIQNYIAWRFAKTYKKIIKKKKLDSQAEINAYFNKNPLYLSLYDYGYGCKVVNLKEFELKNNDGSLVSYADFINGKPITAKKIKDYEGLDLIIGEAQLGLPNTEHNMLDKKYPWLPVFIALSGHLYNMNIIINSQELQRPWVKLRKQQDIYMRAIKTIPINKTFFKKVVPYLPFFRKYLYTKVRVYEEIQSAENNTLPFKAVGVVNEAGKTVYLTSGQATKEQFEATNGVIKDYYIATPYSCIRYDTRVHHETVFGFPAPKD